MAGELKIAEDLSLPLEAVTEPLGMFANRGKGKSNAGHRLVEQLYHAGLPSIVLDIKGDWYGIRSSADGTGPGLPFLIVGGAHGDAPLETGSGQEWARFLAEQRVPTIIDMSELSKSAARRWVMEFAEELYRTNTEPLMLVVDEADVLIPQRLAADLFRLLGAMEDIAKRGRQRGLGMLVISQRVADVNKSVTDLLETLFLFAITGTRTRKAVLDWIDDHADVEEARSVTATLSSMPAGECWVWSPGWLRILQRFTWLRPETFDSHATPAPGQKRRPIKTMADVDISTLKEQMGETIERAAAEDPKALQKRILVLERQLAASERRVSEPGPAETIVEVVHVPTLPPMAHEAAQLLSDLAQRLADGASQFEAACAQIELDGQQAATDRPGGGTQRRLPPSSTGRAAEGSPAPSQRITPTRTSPPVDGDVKIGKGERITLAAIAQHDSVTRTQLTVLTGYKRSTRDAYVQRLSSAGLVQLGVDKRIRATQDGIDALGSGYEPLPTGDALRDWWLTRLPEGERRIFSVLIGAWPDGVTRDELSDATGYKRSTRDAYIQRLGAKEIVAVEGSTIFAVDHLFDS